MLPLPLLLLLLLLLSIAATDVAVLLLLLLLLLQATQSLLYSNFVAFAKMLDSFNPLPPSLHVVGACFVLRIVRQKFH